MPPHSKILQFGAGRFLRAFFDRFVDQANAGRIVVVQSTPGSRAEMLGRQGDGFRVLIRGYEDGQVVDRVETVRSVSRAIVADSQWGEVLGLATSPELTLIVTNATEAGYVLSAGDALPAVPATMPGKLTAVLWERFQAGLPPLTILPCELIEHNAEKLRELVRAQARQWKCPDAFLAWIGDRCQWLCNLVDCIVTVPPPDHPLAKDDPLLVCAEPYALLAIERPSSGMPLFFTHPAVRVVEDLQPFYLRKVRILNGTHSAMAARFLPAGFQTVRQVLEDREAARWVRGLMFEEILPTLAWRVADTAAFADATFDRLRNPFLNHRLTDIAANHAAKVPLRLQPTFDEYTRLFGCPPRRLSEVIDWRP